jgi:hypothetical protein
MSPSSDPCEGYAPVWIDSTCPRRVDEDCRGGALDPGREQRAIRLRLPAAAVALVAGTVAVPYLKAVLG